MVICIHVMWRQRAGSDNNEVIAPEIITVPVGVRPIPSNGTDTRRFFFSIRYAEQNIPVRRFGSRFVPGCDVCVCGLRNIGEPYACSLKIIT